MTTTSDSVATTLLSHWPQRREQVMLCFTAKPGEYVAHLLLSAVDERRRRMTGTGAVEYCEPELTLTQDERESLRLAVRYAMSGKYYQDAYACEPVWATDYCAYVGTPGFDPAAFIKRVQSIYDRLKPEDNRLELTPCLCGSTSFNRCEMAATRLAESREASAVHA